MSNSSYGTNLSHQEHIGVQGHVHSGHPVHQTSMTPGLNSFLNHTSQLSLAPHQPTAQLQLQSIRTNGTSDTHITTRPSPLSAAGHSGLYDPQHVQLTSALEKNFFKSAVAGTQPSGQRYYAQTNQVQPVSQHHQSNTILITNNFAAHQYGTTASHVPNAPTQMHPHTTIIGGVSPTVTTTRGYNNAASSNINIITTLPDTIHHQQLPDQHVYNIAKEVELHDDIMQVPQFYHAPHQTSAYAQQISSMLPGHFTQHFTAPSTATAQTSQNDDQQQQHQYFTMTMTNDSGDCTTPATSLTTLPKVLPDIGADIATASDAVTTSSKLLSSPVKTSTSNSTLVLDRINICINNHYSDSLPSNNSQSTTTLEPNAAAANSVMSIAAHTFSTAAHVSQQPSPIIPAIHHKVALEAVVSSGSAVTLQTEPYFRSDSTLAIDEPDSTTTTPHTPPTTPENSSPPPSSTLTSTTTIVTPQVMTAEIVIEDSKMNYKQNYITSQTVGVPSIKWLGANREDENGSSSSGTANITQSIELLDDDESDYANSETDNEKETARVSISNDEILEIDDDDIELSNNIKAVSIDALNVESSEQNTGEMSASKVVESDIQKSSTLVKPTQIVSDETTKTVTLLTLPTHRTLPSGMQQETLRIETKAANDLLTQPEVSFNMGEDVFIRKDDGRQYLGTVIGSNAAGGRDNLRQVQYLIRFDDNSELWCGTDQMRRLGSRSGNGNAQMCVACKRTDIKDIVEICHDCRRGYHRSCTKETLTGSEVWWCLRCNKPMKDTPNINGNIMDKPITNFKNSYKTYVDISKNSPASLKPKTPADVYEFHTDNEIFTSDDEIPIKHIIEKTRKFRDSTQHTGTNRQHKPTKKPNNLDGGTLSEIIFCLEDENANDAKIGNKTLHGSNKERLQNISSIDISSKLSNSQHNMENNESDSVLINVDNKFEQNTSTSGYIDKAPSIVAAERTSRKRKAFTLSNTYKEVAAEAASKRYDSSRICDSSSDENSSSSRGTSLDVIIPAPKNFLGQNNPFRMITPKKGLAPKHPAGVSAGCMQSLFNFNRSGTLIKNSIFNTTAFDFSSKLAALKSAGIFSNLSTSSLVKAAGQPRTVRTIKRRLSAKDITIGPNQEVRRRRTRRLSSNVEVISTTTINTIPTNFFPIHAKDLLTTHTLHPPTSYNRILPSFSKQQPQQRQQSSQQQTAASACISSLSSTSSMSSSPPGSVVSSIDSQAEIIPPIKPSHGRRLRQRPQKSSPGNSRRSSISSSSTASSSNSSSNMTLATLQKQKQTLHTNKNKNTTNNGSTDGNSLQDLTQSVKEYFGGAVNRIESGEQFCVRAKRQLGNGQMQYLIEWGDASGSSPQTQTSLASVASSSSTTGKLEGCI